MGLEDFNTILQPASQEIRQNSVTQTLKRLGFVEDALQQFGTGDRVAYTRNDGKQVIETLVVSGLSSPEYLVRYVSIRFAICQPSTVIEEFMSVIRELSTTYNMNIQEGYGDVVYPPERIDDFQQKVYMIVERLKKNWAMIFGGDTEELLMPVGQAWQHFINKHPGVVKSPHS